MFGRVQVPLSDGLNLVHTSCKLRQRKPRTGATNAWLDFMAAENATARTCLRVISRGAARDRLEPVRLIGACADYVIEKLARMHRRGTSIPGPLRD